MTRDPSSTVWTLHRKGSPYCHFRKDGSKRVPGDADFKDWQFEQLPKQEQEKIILSYQSERKAA